MKLLFSFLILILSLYGAEKPLEKVSLQLQWLDQFQFAGYYMAKEKGFYKEKGLALTIKPYRSGVDTLAEVLEGRSTFGIGRASLISASSHGKKISLIAAIYQSSPLVMIALKSSNIQTLSDFKGKKVMMTRDAIETASLSAMIMSAHVDRDSLHYMHHNFDINSLIKGTTDLYSGYISNEPYILEEKGVEYKLFYPQEYGFDFYEDILFTSRKNVKNNPQQVKDFKEASLKGWRYAFEHIDESVEFIYKHYNPQNKSKDALRYEAKELKKLAYYHTSELGKLDVNKLQRIYDVYRLMGLVKNPLDLEELIFTDNKFTKEERAYLKKKGPIKICVLPNSKPYSAIVNGKYVGVGSQILALTQKEIDIKYQLVPTASWMESLKKGSNKECDLLPIAAATPSRKQFFNYTTPYHEEPLVIITKKDKNYIIDFETVLDKTFSIVKGHSFIEVLQRKYPSIKLVQVSKTEDGLRGVQEGKYYGHIDVLMGAAYGMKVLQDNSLQISGQFDKKIAVSFAVRKDDPTLFTIFEKLSNSLKPSQLQTILNEWVQINYTKGIHFKHIVEGVAFFLFLVLLFLFKTYILNKKNEKLESLQKEILEINENLETRVAQAVSDLEKAQSIAKTGSWILEVKNLHLKWSKETYRIFEVDTHKVENLYQYCLNKLHPDDRDKMIASYKNALAEGKNYESKHRLVMDDGRVKYVLEKCEMHYDADGESIVSYGTVQDITESTLLQEEIEKKDAYLLQQSRLAQMGEMLSMIAHQWKQPLSAISSTEITLKTTIELEKYNLADVNERKEFLHFLDVRLDKIALYVQNLSKTIRDFSNFYKPHKKAKLASVDSVVMSAYELVKDSMLFSKVETKFDLRANSFIYMHENEFMQVILNIITNAKDQMIDKDIENPSIILRSFVENKNIVIEIEDNAGGIESENLEKIFDPYFSTKLEKNGTGLGLYMSKMIINEYHKGDLSVANRADGALFKITIPREKE